jgi:uncharacterized protein (UPF0335 family)
LAGNRAYLSKKNLSEFYKEAKSKGFEVSVGTFAEIASSNPDELIKFLNLVDKHNSISEIKDELFKSAGLKSSKELFNEVIQNFISFDQLKQLLLDYQKNGNYLFLWEVICLVKNDVFAAGKPFFELQQLFDLLHSITPENFFFKQANSLLFEIINTQEVPSKQEKLLFLEEKFRYALQSESQDLADQLFNELCGYKGLTPVIKKVKGDIETLINIAKQMRELNQRVEDLEAKEKNYTEEEKKANTTFWKKL